jgi:hypothetical protein
MGCSLAKPAKVTVAPSTPDENSARQLLQSLKSKKEGESKPVDDKSSSESEKRSAAIETFTWEVYTYADREESYRCIMNYYRSRMAFRAFFLGRAKSSGSSGYMIDRNDSPGTVTGKDDNLFSAWEKASEMSRMEYENTANQNSISAMDFDAARVFFDSMKVESVNLPSIPLVTKAKSANIARGNEENGSDKGISANLQSLHLFFKSPMYLTWRAEESARVGEITATNLSVKSFSFRDSVKARASVGNERCSLAELAFTLVHPPAIDLITNCSSWLGTFVAAAEGLPFALFLCECDGTDPTGYPILYLNPPSAVLFHCDRRDVIDNNLKIPCIPGLQTNIETENDGNLRSKVIVKLQAKSINNILCSNYLCVKSIFDQSRKARFIVGMHGDVEKMSSRRDVKMLEVLLGILPDNVTDDK